MISANAWITVERDNICCGVRQNIERKRERHKTTTRSSFPEFLSDNYLNHLAMLRSEASKSLSLYDIWTVKVKGNNLFECYLKFSPWFEIFDTPLSEIIKPPLVWSLLR